MAASEEGVCFTFGVGEEEGEKEENDEAKGAISGEAHPVWRFRIGEKVKARRSSRIWSTGTVVAHDYEEAGVGVCPYQIRLDDEAGTLIVAPYDEDVCVRAAAASAAASAATAAAAQPLVGEKSIARDNAPQQSIPWEIDEEEAERRRRLGFNTDGSSASSSTPFSLKRPVASDLTLFSSSASSSTPFSLKRPVASDLTVFSFGTAATRDFKERIDYAVAKKNLASLQDAIEKAEKEHIVDASTIAEAKDLLPMVAAEELMAAVDGALRSNEYANLKAAIVKAEAEQLVDDDSITEAKTILKAAVGDEPFVVPWEHLREFIAFLDRAPSDRKEELVRSTLDQVCCIYYDTTLSGMIANFCRAEAWECNCGKGMVAVLKGLQYKIEFVALQSKDIVVPELRKALLSMQRSLVHKRCQLTFIAMTEGPDSFAYSKRARELDVEDAKARARAQLELDREEEEARAARVRMAAEAERRRARKAEAERLQATRRQEALRRAEEEAAREEEEALVLSRFEPLLDDMAKRCGVLRGRVATEGPAQTDEDDEDRDDCDDAPGKRFARSEAGLESGGSSPAYPIERWFDELADQAVLLVGFGVSDMKHSSSFVPKLVGLICSKASEDLESFAWSGDGEGVPTRRKDHGGNAAKDESSSSSSSSSSSFSSRTVIRTPATPTDAVSKAEKKPLQSPYRWADDLAACRYPMTIACAELCLRLTASCRSQSLVLEDALVSRMETAFAEVLPPNDNGDDGSHDGGAAGGASSQGADAGQTRTSIKMSDDDAALQVRFAAFAGQLARRRLLPEKLVHTDLLNRLLAALDLFKRSYGQLAARKRNVDAYDSNVDASTDECAICCEPLAEQAVSLTPCQHYFHSACITNAIRIGYRNCPLCRADLLSGSHKAEDVSSRAATATSSSSSSSSKKKKKKLPPPSPLGLSDLSADAEFISRWNTEASMAMDRVRCLCVVEIVLPFVEGLEKDQSKKAKEGSGMRRRITNYLKVIREWTPTPAEDNKADADADAEDVGVEAGLGTRRTLWIDEYGLGAACRALPKHASDLEDRRKRFLDPTSAKPTKQRGKSSSRTLDLESGGDAKKEASVEKSENTTNSQERKDAKKELQEGRHGEASLASSVAAQAPPPPSTEPGAALRVDSGCGALYDTPDQIACASSAAASLPPRPEEFVGDLYEKLTVKATTLEAAPEPGAALISLQSETKKDSEMHTLKEREEEALSVSTIVEGTEPSTRGLGAAELDFPVSTLGHGTDAKTETALFAKPEPEKKQDNKTKKENKDRKKPKKTQEEKEKKAPAQSPITLLPQPRPPGIERYKTPQQRNEPKPMGGKLDSEHEINRNSTIEEILENLSISSASRACLRKEEIDTECLFLLVADQSRCDAMKDMMDMGLKKGECIKLIGWCTQQTFATTPSTAADSTQKAKSSMPVPGNKKGARKDQKKKSNSAKVIQEGTKGAAVLPSASPSAASAVVRVRKGGGSSAAKKVAQQVNDTPRGNSGGSTRATAASERNKARPAEATITKAKAPERLKAHQKMPKKNKAASKQGQGR